MKNAVYGTFYDGNSTRAQLASVTHHEEGELALRGVSLWREVSRRHVRVSQPLGNTVRSVTFADGAVLECVNTPGFEALLGEPEANGRRFVQLCERYWPAAYALFWLGLGGLLAALLFGVPALVRSQVAHLPPAVLQHLTQAALGKLEYRELKPSQLSSAQRASVVQLLGQVTQPVPELIFRRARVPTTFALPDGSLLVSDELVLLAANEQELVGVLLHEVGHIQHDHHLTTGPYNAARLSPHYLGKNLGSLLTWQPLTELSGTGNERYSAEQEAAATRFALQAMRAANISAEHAESLRLKISALQGKQRSYAERHAVP